MRTSITPSDVLGLRDAKLNLEILDLLYAEEVETGAGDVVVGELVRLWPDLQVLGLSRVGVSDELFVHASRLEALEFLNVTYCAIRGRGAAQLRHAKALRRAALHGTELDSGV